MSSIEDSIIEMIRSRQAVGERKYGTTLDRTDLSLVDWLKHALEESLDHSLYLQKIIRIVTAMEDNVILEIIAERKRQVEKGFDAAHDDTHGNGELYEAAKAYLVAAKRIEIDTMPMMWPFEKMEWRHPGSKREALIKAAAMLVAEINRLQRADALISDSSY